jgi:aminoglycoside phosphotransferase (APT) family kinase protein
MEFVDGTIYRMPEQLFSVRDAKALANSLVDTLTTLHRVTPEAFGLGSLGRPDGYAERQVRTWIRQLDASKSRELPELARLAERLAADVPVNPKHAIVHGDYRLDNVVVGTDADLAAVLDWEMSTLGDPLTDLASLAVWWDGLAGLDSPVAAVPGEYLDVDSTYLMNRYAENIGAEPARMNWYLAFAYFKVAAIFEGIYFRFSQGQTVGAGFDRIGALVAPMTEAGHRELDS